MWTHGEEELLKFVELADNTHAKIKFTKEYSRYEIPFLDVLVSLKSGELSTSIYSKPTDTHTYLRYESFHPHHIKSSLIYSQAIRLKRICSDPVDFEHRIHDLSMQLIDRGYPLSLIKEQIAKARLATRESLLRYNRKRESDNRIPFVVKHHPTTRKLSKQIKSSWKILNENTSLGDLSRNPPLLPPNNHLISNRYLFVQN